MIVANENNILLGKCFPIYIIRHSTVEVCSKTLLVTQHVTQNGSVLFGCTAIDKKHMNSKLQMFATVFVFNTEVVTNSYISYYDEEHRGTEEILAFQ